MIINFYFGLPRKLLKGGERRKSVNVVRIHLISICIISLVIAIFYPSQTKAQSCTFQGGPAPTTNISLNLDPSLGNATATNSALTMRCRFAPVIAYTVAVVSGGVNLTKSTGFGCPCIIPYTFTISTNPPSPVPRNTIVTVTTQATVLLTNFQDSPAGSYIDNVVLQVTP